MAKANNSITPETKVTLSPVAMIIHDHAGTGKGTIVKKVKGGYHVRLEEPNRMKSCPVCKGRHISQNRTTKEFRCVNCIGNPDDDHRGGFTSKVVHVKVNHIIAS